MSSELLLTSLIAPEITAPLPGAPRAEEDLFLRRAFRHHSRTFSLATRLLPMHVRGAVATVYMFCRAVDTVADELPRRAGRKRAFRQLETMSRSLYLTLEGRPPDELLWRRLAEVHETFGLPSEPMFELLKGAVWDIEERPIRSLDDLLAYADHVAGSVGVIMLPFLVDTGPVSRDLEGDARALGQAMQISNILRDVGEDLQVLDRTYLPLDMIERHGLTMKDLLGAALAPPKRGRYAALVEELMDVADALYEESIAAVSRLAATTQLGIIAAARMYRELHNEIRALGYDNLHHRAFVSVGRKVLVIAHDDYARRKLRLLRRC